RRRTPDPPRDRASGPTSARGDVADKGGDLLPAPLLVEHHHLSAFPDLAPVHRGGHAEVGAISQYDVLPLHPLDSSHELLLARPGGLQRLQQYLRLRGTVRTGQGLLSLSH